MTVAPLITIKELTAQSWMLRRLILFIMIINVRQKSY